MKRQVKTQHLVFRTIEEHWPISVSEVHDKINVASSTEVTLEEINYYFDKLKHQGKIKMKKVGGSLVAWPAEIDDLRLVDELVKNRITLLSKVFKKYLVSGGFFAGEGRIRLFGRQDWILIPSRAFALFLQYTGKKLGPEYLWRLGYNIGKDASKEMLESMHLKPRGGWLTLKPILELLDFIGFGKPEFLLSKIEKSGRHHIILHVTQNPVIEHAARLFGSNSLVCNWFMGVYTAHGEAELGIKNGHLKENKCLTKGFPYCEWETKW